MPNWCNQSPFELVYLLRKALENEYVSSNLNEWIDMIFGVASSGEQAKEHFNVFSPILLSDIWKINNYKTCSGERKEFIETCLSKSGQIPKPLFKTKHPKRSNCQRFGFEYSQEYESIEKSKQNTEILPLFIRNEEELNKTEMDKEKNLIKTATILFESPRQIKVVCILGSGKIETYTITVSLTNFVSILSSPSDSMTSSSSSTDISNTNDYLNAENGPTNNNNNNNNNNSNNNRYNNNNSNNNNNNNSGNIPLDPTAAVDNNNSSNNSSSLREKRELVVSKDINERFLSDVDAKTKFYSLENGIIVLNKDKLRFITANSISCSSDSNINYSSISPLFESDLLVCDSCDSITIVNNEGVILVSSFNQSISSSSLLSSTQQLSNSFISSSFLSFLSSSSPSLDENSSSEVLTLASLSTNSNPHSKINLFTKSGKKQIEYELEFKRIGRAHCEKPLVIASSKSFDILAITSIEGNVNLYSLLNGIYECTCYTCDEPAEKILITPGWGFIVAASIQDVYLFNVNGFLIRKIAKSYNIVKWCTWTDDKGFDFLAVIKDDGSLVVSEAFYLSFSEPIQIIRGPPIVMKYCQDMNSILIVTKNKKFYSIPVPSK